MAQQLVSDWTKIQTQACLSPKSNFFPYRIPQLTLV